MALSMVRSPKRADHDLARSILASQCSREDLLASGKLLPFRWAARRVRRPWLLRLISVMWWRLNRMRDAWLLEARRPH